MMKRAWCVLRGLSAVAALGCSTNPVTGKREVILIPQSQEVALGQEAAPKFEEEFGGRVPDDALQAYVRSVGNRVAATSDRPMPYEFTLLRSDVPNAFALHGVLARRTSLCCVAGPPPVQLSVT